MEFFNGAHFKTPGAIVDSFECNPYNFYPNYRIFAEKNNADILSNGASLNGL
jgi:hypothetical protein